jgi:hypothetical protein
MRTWLHALSQSAHPIAASLGASVTDNPHDKERVPVPGFPGPPHALAKETGCPVGITARRTGGALA